MPRPPRFELVDVPQHVVQRGNNRQATLFADSDFRFYKECLRDAADKHGCEVHAYVLMTNHVHLLATPRETDSVSRALQYVGPIHRVTLRPPGSPSKPPLQVVYVFREVNDATG